MSNVQENYFHKVKNFNILQSFAYARAQAISANQVTRIGLIEIDKQEAGYIQILEAGILKNLIHAVILDRGPLWFEGYGSAQHFEAFLTTFNKEFPKRFGRKTRLIPEMNDTPEIRRILENHNYKRSPAPGYETAWIDLTQSDETLRRNLKKNWRGTLQKAEKSDLTIHWDDKGQDFKWLMQNYATDKAAKGYDGPSVKLIHEMAKSFAREGNMLIGTTRHKDQKIGSILLFLHRPGATYQIGWTSDLGRQKGAHHLLLWQALPILKERGIKALDLGGMNDETAQGVKKFKTGLGGEPITLPGLYT